MLYAEVAVNIPVRPTRAGVEGDVPQSMTFHYHVPSGLNVRPGQLVWVSFGVQQVQGIVLALSETAPVTETKPILAICDPQPYLNDYQQHLVRWLADYYLCSISDAAFMLLPPGIQQRAAIVIEPVAHPTPSALAGLNQTQQQVWQLLTENKRLTLDDLRRRTRLGNARTIVDQLLRRGLITRYREIQEARVRPKLVRTARLVADDERVHAEIARLAEPRLRKARLLRTLIEAGTPLPVSVLCQRANCPRSAVAALVDDGLLRIEARRGPVALARDVAALQAVIEDLETLPTRGTGWLLSLLAQDREPMDVSELMKITGVSSAQVQALVERGLLRVDAREARRDPLAQRTFAATTPPALTRDQETVYRSITEELHRPRPRPILLYGVTGSGKTEIYLRVLQDALAMGRQAIIMVPEIALTPQTIHRFASRFAGKVAVLHSRLSMGEHFDEWRRIRDGQVDIVIGSRSAVFAPLPRLGLIVMDEEHEWTYKQTDMPPRYHARDVALKLAELTGALVVLGSATPDVVSYQRGLNGEFKLLTMPERVVRAVGGQQEAEGVHLSPAPPALAGGGVGASTVVESPLPPVEIVDLRAELRAGNRSIFSRALHKAMTVALAANQQIILFLNRRGTATFIMCRDCGYVLRCKKCDSPLGYHEAEDDLVCHQCNRRYLVPQVCPQCWSKRIKFFGIGTQKVEQEMHNLFPTARTLRWDRDVTTGKMSHEQILDRFIRHEADVLIGTQMIAKGLDLPLVTLVGVVSADTALHLPDFRAGERTFQILTQVAGRAGRSTLGGRVIIQTYTPEHYAIKAASHHDYTSFARQELAFRAARGYPPFSHLARLLLQHPNKDKAQAEAERMHQLLKLRIGQLGLPETTLIGPVPCFVTRLRGRYRWQIIIQAQDVQPLLRGVPLPAGWTVDVDPVSLL